MKFLKLRKSILMWGLIAMLALLMASSDSYAVFGLGKKVFDGSTMIPYLKKQLQETRKVLRTANRQLGELRSINRGARNMRRYVTDNYDSPYVQIMREVDAIEDEADGIKNGGSRNVYTYDNLPEGLQRAYEKHKKKEELEAKQRKHELRIARKGDVSANYTENITIDQLEKDQKRFRLNSDRSQSLAESSKITNEGLSLLLESNTESLRIQKEQLKLQSANLYRDLKKDEENQVEGMIDGIIIQNAFRNELQ